MYYGYSLHFLAHLFEEIDESVNATAKAFRPVPSMGVLSVGQGCVAKYNDDGQWYRATILNIADRAEVSLHIISLITSNQPLLLWSCDMSPDLVLYPFFLSHSGRFCRFW